MSSPVPHLAAGLLISADRRLPGFVVSAADRPPDVRIHLTLQPDWHAAPSAPVYTSDQVDGAGVPVVRVSRSAAGFDFDYADRTRIWVAATGTDVWCTWPASASLEDTCTYLCGPVLSLVLRVRGALAIHASAVQAGGGAVAFIGPHGAGKSTLAAALGAAGHPVVTDDVLHVREEGGRWIVEPFASMLRLWPDGAQLALGADAELPEIAAGWDKRALHLGGAIPAAAGPLPLAALACLTARGLDTEIASISRGSALVELAANSSAAHLLDARMKAVEFSLLSSLVRAVPCATITAPAARAAFPRFVERIVEWMRPLTASTAG